MWRIIVVGVAITLATVAVMYRERTQERAIEIAAPPEEVWRVLTGLKGYPQWNPFIVHITAPQGMAPGRKLNVRIRNNGSEMGFAPKVLVADQAQELRWVGRLGLPGLLDGEHSFRLERTAEGTRFIQGETFRGVLVPVVGSSIDVADSFEAMNAALRDRVLATITR